MGRVDLVTVGATDPPVGMSAPVPMHSVATFVTGCTCLILNVARNRFVEDTFRCWSLVVRSLLQVRGAFPVATDTAGCAAIGHGAVLGLADGEHTRAIVIGFIMAGGAFGIAAQHRIAFA